MKIGLTLPQGCDREYLGMEAREAWERTIDVARWGEERGFESLWLYDHFQVDPPLVEAPIFEPFVELSALAMVTSRATAGAARPTTTRAGTPATSRAWSISSSTTWSG